MSTSPSNFSGMPDASLGEDNSTKTCTNCGRRKPLHHFVSGSGKRSLQRCASCRESDAASKAKKRLAEHRQPTYLRRGQDSQDAPEVAAARAEIVKIKRQNRVARRHGELPPHTPTLSSMARRRRGDGDGDDDVVDPIGMISESRYGGTDSFCRFSINTKAAAPINRRCNVSIEPSLCAFHGATTRHETPTYPGT